MLSDRGPIGQAEALSAPGGRDSMPRISHGRPHRRSSPIRRAIAGSCDDCPQLAPFIVAERSRAAPSDRQHTGMLQPPFNGDGSSSVQRTMIDIAH